MNDQPARTSFSKLKPAQCDEILHRYQAGDRPVDIARDFGVTEWTIQNVRKRAGVPTRPKGLSEQALARAAELYAEGVSFRKIAIAVGCHARTVAAEIRARNAGSR
ncbi:helix-turn-helix domain-containing protein [Microbacterium sp. HMWF026]|uniref:helix-turn-helix domain-containing protein n=1 Tax=Microbacterium sp. HMWF026 TaxID=2056861 RepID=UPI0011B1EB73|nr:helix-turn-helix domain-containing protein [Microbacterium sp. HMWF026]